MVMNRIINPKSIRILALVAGLFLLAIAAFSQKSEDEFTTNNPRVREVMAVQEDITPGLMSVEEVLGTAVGQDNDGEPIIIVFINSEAKNYGQVIRSLPPEIRGKRLKALVTDKFRAMPAKGGGTSVSHTAKQIPPIQLGTSGGWRNDLANGYCCGGTLGSLIVVSGVQYIMSNYHVFEADIVSGGNSYVAENGDPIIQPGLIDASCAASNAQEVATLVKIRSLPGSNVDVSIAQVIPGMVRPDGSILEIGTIFSKTVVASLKQGVKKSGRTTGLTRSTVYGLNGTISVTYADECAGGTAFTKTFTGQILIANAGKKFLNAGDSGSLMVEDVKTNPKAVGLLYAGSSTLAVANPINEVLTFVGNQLGGPGALPATMVGQ
jgi:hypothetical protein